MAKYKIVGSNQPRYPQPKISTCPATPNAVPFESSTKFEHFSKNNIEMVEGNVTLSQKAVIFIDKSL